MSGVFSVSLFVENERYVETEDGLVHEVFEHFSTWANCVCGLPVRRPSPIDSGYPPDRKIKRFFEKGVTTCLGCLSD